jgi:hypothetical protein
MLPELVRRKEFSLEEEPLLPDQAQRLLSVPPKYSGVPVVGFPKGESAIRVA